MPLLASTIAATRSCAPPSLFGDARVVSTSRFSIMSLGVETSAQSTCLRVRCRTTRNFTYNQPNKATWLLRLATRQRELIPTDNNELFTFRARRESSIPRDEHGLWLSPCNISNSLGSRQIFWRGWPSVQRLIRRHDTHHDLLVNCLPLHGVPQR
jgi:hypothetical protein